MNKACIKAYEDILRLKFAPGKELLEQEKKNNPQNLLPYYIENYVDFLTAIITEEDIQYKNHEKNLSERIKILKKGDQSSPYYKYCIAELYIHLGLTKVKFNNFLPGIFELNRAYRLLQNNQKEFPDFLLNKKSIGMLNVLIAVLHNNYDWLDKFSPYKTTVEQGMNEIMEAVKFTSDKYNHMQSECLFIYTYLFLNFTVNNSNHDDIRDLYKSPKITGILASNPLLQYSLANIYIRYGENDKAVNLLQSINTENFSINFHYLDFLVAKTKLNRLDKDSYKYLFRFIQKFNGKYYIKSAYQKLAWFYLLEGNTEKYKEYISRVIDHGTGIIEEDKQAQYEAECAVIPNVTLLKARLLFDGSYFKQSLEVIMEIDPGSDLQGTKDSVEYFYRLGRIYHESGDIKNAIINYQKTIGIRADQRFYYPANAALKLANIYEEQHKYNDALYYYEMVLYLDFFEYRNSIIREAKQGLTRIKT